MEFKQSQKIKSLQQTLTFLKTITGTKQIQSNLNQQQTLQKKKINKDDTIQNPNNKQKFQNSKKQIDENKVLKRILGSLQPTMHNYYNNPNQDEYIHGRSGTTRLNIYLKQNQRILKNLQLQQIYKHRARDIDILDLQEKLEKQYFFTIKDSYRQELEIVVSKNRISKQNYKSTQFNEVLVNLIDNQLKIYKDLTGKRLLRSIKLYQLENVEYNSQPFPFIIISFIKDKSKSLEYLYLKFKSIQDQEKWDRILYINFRLKDMKLKQKLFQGQFKDQEDQIKIQQKKPYGVDIYKIIDELTQNTESKIIIPKSSLKQEKILPGVISLNKLNLETKKLMEQKNKPPQQSDRVPQPQIPIITITKAQTLKSLNQTNEEKGPHLNRNLLSFEQIQQQFPLNQKNLQKNKILYLQKKNQQLLTSTKKSKVIELTQRLSEGINVKKQNFFRNKDKKVMVHDDHFQYFDQDDYSKALAKGDISKAGIKKIYIKDVQKLQLVAQNKVEIIHSNNKKLIMIGDLTEFCQWLKLKLIQQ